MTTEQGRSAAMMSALRLALALLPVVAFAGCASRNGMAYTAAKLPMEYQAQRAESTRGLDLSRLATAGSASNIIENGDVLEVNIAAGLSAADSTTHPVRVSDKGMAHLPILGSLQLAGLELSDAETAIASACEQRGLYRSPHVTVTMKHQRMNRVTVVGAVKKPGVYSLPRGSSDLLSAIMSAGGLADDAGTNVEIRQPQNASDVVPPERIAGESEGAVPQVAGHSLSRTTGMKSTTVDLVSATKDGTGGQAIVDGGVIMVEQREQVPVQIIGLVRKPGRYDFPQGQDLRVLDAVALANGVSNQLADKILISRAVPSSPDPVVITVSIGKAKRRGDVNLRLAPGDVVSIEQTPATVFLDVVHIVRFGVSSSLGLLF